MISQFYKTSDQQWNSQHYKTTSVTSYLLSFSHTSSFLGMGLLYRKEFALNGDKFCPLSVDPSSEYLVDFCFFLQGRSLLTSSFAFLDIKSLEKGFTLKEKNLFLMGTNLDLSSEKGSASKGKNMHLIGANPFLLE